MFVELHIVQNFPPSNLNRDDLGQPKDADFGGYRRARISSQCLKRSTRYAGYNPDTSAKPVFAKYTGVPLSSRTKRIIAGLASHLTDRSIDKENAERAAKLFAEAYAKKQTDDGETPTLIFLSADEFGWAARELATNWDAVLAAIQASEQKPPEDAKPAKGKKAKADKQETSIVTQLAEQLAKETAGRSSAPDIALFGRMLADRPSTNVNAACQVAHAISTNSIAGRTPIDYYTAIDDLKTDPGAGFLDVAYFNSACFYRYARLDYAQLKTNLGVKDLQGNDLADLPLRTVEAFMRASEAAIPSGKKNAFAPECRPSFMLAVVREKESDGWSLVNAFQKPVNVHTKGEEDLVLASVKRLEKQFKHLMSFYGDETVKAIAVALPDGTVEAEDLGMDFRDNVKNMKDWVGTVCNELRKGG